MEDLKQGLLNWLKPFLDEYIGSRLEEWRTDICNKAEEKSDVITRKEAMTLLHVSSPTLWRYGKNGLLHPHNICGKTYYSRNEIMEYLSK